MRKFFEALWSTATVAVAFALLALILWLAIRVHSNMWRRVAGRYSKKARSAPLAQKLEVAVIAERGLRPPKRFRNSDYRKYAGLLLAIHDEGLALSLIPPFNINCPPVFLPFDEMELERTDWALWRDPFAMRMRKLPDVDIVVGRETVGWLREYIQRTPFGLDN